MQDLQNQESSTQSSGLAPRRAVSNYSKAYLRLSARYIDLLLWYSFTWLVLALVANKQFLEFHESSLGFLYLSLSLIPWTFIEAGLLSRLGYTPGKWLLQIRIAGQDGKRLSYGQALARSWLVALCGLGLQIPLVDLVALFMSYYRLTKSGGTVWDDRGAYSISYEKNSLNRSLMVAVVISWLILARYFLFKFSFGEGAISLPF